MKHLYLDHGQPPGEQCPDCVEPPELREVLIGLTLLPLRLFDHLVVGAYVRRRRAQGRAGVADGVRR